MAEPISAMANADGSSRRPITVLIADDQQMVRRGFRVILEAEQGISVVAEAGDGPEAVELVRAVTPRPWPCSTSGCR